MSVPVVLQFLAETDDLLRQVNQVKGSVDAMLSGVGQTLSAVESVVNRAISSTNEAVEQVQESVGQAVSSTEAVAFAVEQAVARAIAGANANVLAAHSVIDQTVAAADAAVDGVSKAIGSVHGVIDETVTAAEAAVQSVDLVASHAQETIVGRFVQINQAARSIIEEIQATVGLASSVIEPLQKRSKEALEAMEAQVKSVSAAGVVGFGALGASTVVAASSALSAARQYEDLEARLRGLTGSAEEAAVVFKEAVQWAAVTPFEVTEIVSATGTMQAFGQLSRENMEAVGNIAAATGQRLEDTALRMAKALAGTSEGFQGLRDVSGITAQRLAKYGAVLADASNVSLKGEANIRKATRALQELARVEFAGNMAKQSATYSGAISNAEDAIMTMRATLGQGLVPVATVAAGVVASLADAATALIAPMQGVIPYIAGLALGVSAVGTTLFAVAGTMAGFIARSLIMQATLGTADLVLGKFGLSLGMVRTRAMGLILANDAAAAAIMRLRTAALTATGAIGQLGARAAAAMPTLAALSSGAILGGFAALAAAAGVAYFAISRMEQRAVSAGKELERSSRSFQSAAQGFRSVAVLLNQVTGQDLTWGATVAENVAEAKAALDSMSDLEVANMAAAAGKGFADLEADLKNTVTAADAAKTKIWELTQELEAAKEEARTFAALPDGVEPDNQKIRELAAALAAVRMEHENLGKSSGVLREFIARIAQIDPALTNAVNTAKSLDAYMKFAGSLETVGKLEGALKVVNGNIKQMQADMMSAFGTIDRFELGAKLTDPAVAGNKAAVAAIEEYLARLDDRDKIQETITKKTEEQSQRQIAAHEAVTARMKVLGELTLQQERARIAEQLSMVEEGSEQETQILERLASKDREIRSRREQIAKESLDRQVRAIEDSMADVSSNPSSTAAQVSDSLRAAITSLERFGEVNKAAFAGAPEAAEEYRRRLSALRNELRQSEAKELAENLQQLKTTLAGGIDSGGTTAQQLVQIGQAIITLKQAMAGGSVEQSGAEEYLTSLEAKKLDLIRRQTTEKLKQVDEIAGLQRQALDGEIEVLEARLAAGENVEEQLMNARRMRTQFELEQIDEVLRREIEAGGDATLAEQKAALAREAIYRREALEKYKASQPPREQQQQQRQRGQSGSRGAFAERMASNSPLSNSSSFFSGVDAAALPSFADGFGEKWVRRERTPRAPRFETVAQQARVERENYQRQQKSSDEKAAQAGGTVYNITVNADVNSSDPDAKAAARAIGQLARNQARQDKLMGRGKQSSLGNYGALQMEQQ